MYFLGLPSDLFSPILASFIVHCWSVFPDWKLDYHLHCWRKDTIIEKDARYFQPRKLNSGEFILWKHFAR